MILPKTLLAGAAVLLMAGPGAQAADLGPIFTQAPELTPVEIGSGWYLRGDVSYDFETDLDGSRTLGTPFAATGFGYDEMTLEDGFAGGLGIGYQFTDMLRGDVTARYGQSDLSGTSDFSFACGGLCSLRDTADVQTWDVMANAYLDLGTFAGFTPYVGGGVGGVQVNYEDANVDFCSGLSCSTLSLDGEKDWRFAYSLMAGVAYDVSQNLAIDVGYRYLDVEAGNMYGTGGEGFTSLSSQDDGFDRHTIQAGLRYKLW